MAIQQQLRQCQNANNKDVVSNNTTLNVPNKTNENGSGGHLTLKEIQEDVRHSSDKPELVAIAEQASNRPKKRSRRAAPADPTQLQQIQRLQRRETVVHQ